MIQAEKIADLLIGRSILMRAVKQLKGRIGRINGILTRMENNLREKE